MPGLPVVLMRPATAVGHQRAMALEHHDDATAGRQFDGGVVAQLAIELSADQPGELAGVRREDARAAGMASTSDSAAKAFSASASKTIGLAIS